MSCAWRKRNGALSAQQTLRLWSNFPGWDVSRLRMNSVMKITSYVMKFRFLSHGMRRLSRWLRQKRRLSGIPVIPHLAPTWAAWKLCLTWKLPQSCALFVWFKPISDTKTKFARLKLREQLAPNLYYGACQGDGVWFRNKLASRKLKLVEAANTIRTTSIKARGRSRITPCFRLIRKRARLIT